MKGFVKSVLKKIQSINYKSKHKAFEPREKNWSMKLKLRDKEQCQITIIYKDPRRLIAKRIDAGIQFPTLIIFNSSK